MLINAPRPDRFTLALQMRLGELQPSDMDNLRDYGVGATILAELGVKDMSLLTNSHHSLVGLDGYGLSIVSEVPIA